MENTAVNNNTEVTEAKEVKLTLKERLKKTDWKKIGLRALRVGEGALLVVLGYKLGKTAANRPIPVEGTIEESEDDISEADEEEDEA